MRGSCGYLLFFEVLAAADVCFIFQKMRAPDVCINLKPVFHPFIGRNGICPGEEFPSDVVQKEGVHRSDSPHGDNRECDIIKNGKECLHFIGACFGSLMIQEKGVSFSVEEDVDAGGVEFGAVWIS